ncbi:TadE/TadG family type IV pilus assembly protein [Occallatibacter riparius]|uniref:Pilus assembly protein TadG-related protein n=1 Tax=Occallatibacter riparius TaxID=1002689 RepID=A0A9J7BQ74_9BACT|nr:TadE/TadG family type IV pilus assembly protein [Occallatibacter riparius]UWZ84705.1 pilus assembly protein TadG-related protein [Occallatibacter riparius]
MKIVREEEGATLVLVALSMTVLLGFVGLATDVGILLRQRRIAQTVADSAALAGVTESMYEGSPSSVTSGMYTAASHDATMNGFTPGSSNGAANSANGLTLTLRVAPTISGYSGSGLVQATASFATPTIFMNLFGIHSLNVASTAIASNLLNSDGCFNVQNGEGLANPAATMGGSSQLFGQNCGVTINGNLSMGGSSNINAKFVTASGTITNGGSSSITGPVSQNAPPTSDPLSKLQQTANQPQIDTTAKTCTAPSGTGMSCIYNFNSGNLSGTLQSNTMYVFDKNVNGGNGPSITGSVTGSNVTIYLADNIPFSFANNGNLNLTPPGYGHPCAGSLNPLCGVLFDAPSDGANGKGTYTCSHGKGNNYGNPAEIYFDFGSSTSDLEGVIYAPYMQLFVQDQGASTKLANDVIIGNFCSQAATLKIQGYDSSDSPLARVGLIY